MFMLKIRWYHVVSLLAFSFIFGPMIYTEITDRFASPSTVNITGQLTLDKFNAIRNGMTYAEVTDIIGSYGVVTAETGEAGTEYHTIIYSYEGVGEVGANANFTFQGGKLVAKAQYGLR